MNIFSTSKDPVKAAENLDDVRLNKMILESAQMLSTAVIFSLDSHVIKKNKKGRDFKSMSNVLCPELMNPIFFHNFHPCNVWARETKENYNWLLEHTEAMIAEKIFRTGKGHCVEQRIPYFKKYAVSIPNGSLTEFPKSCRNGKVGSFKHLETVEQGYQNYQAAKWLTDKITVKFTKRKIPEWVSPLYELGNRGLYKCLENAKDFEGKDDMFVEMPNINDYVLSMK